MHSPNRRFKSGFNGIELSMIALGCALVAFLLGQQHAPLAKPRAAGNDLERLAARYGPSRHSEHAEEWIVRDFFQDRRAGVFLDVGAYDYKQLSNTYYLETALGWSGIAIDAQAKFADGYQRYRPRTVFLPLFVSDRSDTQVTLHVPPDRDMVASSNRHFTESFARSRELQVTTRTLDAVLDEQHVSRVDFMSMDIELAEPAALRGFSIDRFRPELVCVEANPEVRQAILDYFAAHHYTVVGKYLRADDSNIWFTPLASPGPQ